MTQPAGQHTVKQHNRALVLSQLAGEPGQTRAQIALATGLTRATVSSLVDELIESRLVVELEPGPVARGRPGNPLQLNPQGPAGLGMEINVDYIAACVLDLTGAVRARRIEPLDNTAVTPGVGLRRVASLASVVAAAVDVEVAGVALAVPGLVDAAGVMVEAPNLPQWNGADVGAQLGAMVGGAPVQVHNEANLAALAEHWYGVTVPDFVHVTGEIGVGGGLILGGELFRGVRGFAGEVGHLLVDPEGPMCACGNRGCLEQLAGQGAILRAARAATEDDLLARVSRGERRAVTAVTRAGSALGVALGGVINVVDVPTVVLGGFYARIGQWLVEPLSAELARRVVSRAPVDVRVSSLGSDAATLGAAGLVLQQIIAEPGVPRSNSL